MNKNIRKIKIKFQPSVDVIEYLKSLIEWEKRSKKFNSSLCGPIKRK